MNTNIGHNSPSGEVPEFTPPIPKKRKSYSLDVRNWGDDSYMLASKGHHNIQEFKEECLKEYPHIAEYLQHCCCPCEQLWYKVIPHKEGYSNYYVPVREGCRGAMPVTVWWE